MLVLGVGGTVIREVVNDLFVAVASSSFEIVSYYRHHPHPFHTSLFATKITGDLHSGALRFEKERRGEFGYAVA